MKKVKPRLNPQTVKNAERLKEYQKRMALWVIKYGITHRAIELRYFRTTNIKFSDNQTFKPLTY